MTTIGRLANRFGLSRSTLLYYDRIGLLSPSARTSAGYRDYSGSDEARLEAICKYRDTGLSLDAIGEIFTGTASDLRTALQARYDDLTREMKQLQTQQHLIASLLKHKLPATQKGLTRETWSDLLAASGFDDDAMREWHRAFEKNDPQKHKAFLEFLNIPASEIRKIRRWSVGSGTVDKSHGA